jgi:hypothetical protein
VVLIVLLLAGGVALLGCAAACAGVYFLVSSQARGPAAAEAGSKFREDQQLQTPAISFETGFSEHFGASRAVLSGKDASRAVIFTVRSRVDFRGGRGNHDTRCAILYDLRTGRNLGEKELLDTQFGDRVGHVTLNPEGDRLAMLEGRTTHEEEWNVSNRVFLYSLPDGKPLIERWAIGREILFMRLLGRDRLLTVAGKDVESWDLSRRAPTRLATLDADPKWVLSSHDGRTLAAWDGSRFEILSLAEPGRPRRTDPLDAPKQIRAASFSPDGSRLAITVDARGARNHAVVCWEVATGRILSRGSSEHGYLVWWGDRHLILYPGEGPGQLYEVEKAEALAGVRGLGYLSHSPDGRLWLFEFDQRGMQARAPFVAFDPPSPDVLGAVDAKFDLWIDAKGVKTTKIR